MSSSPPAPAAAAAATRTTPTPPSPVYSQFTRQWLVPGTIVGASVGAATGAFLSGWYNRPMWHSTLNVTAKFGVCSLTYMANLVLLTDKFSPEELPRPYAHVGSGMLTGTLIGGITGRLPGAIRGIVLGSLLAAPIFYGMEGHHQHRFELPPMPTIRIKRPEDRSA